MLLLLAFVLAIGWVVGSIAWIKLHPFLALLSGSLLFGMLTATPAAQLIGQITDGFGRIAASAGLLIALGSLLGKSLEATGILQQLAAAISNRYRPAKLRFAVAALGGLVGISVFCVVITYFIVHGLAGPILNTHSKLVVRNRRFNFLRALIIPWRLKLQCRWAFLRQSSGRWLPYALHP